MNLFILEILRLENLISDLYPIYISRQAIKTDNNFFFFLLFSLLFCFILSYLLSHVIINRSNFNSIQFPLILNCFQAIVYFSFYVRDFSVRKETK